MPLNSKNTRSSTVSHLVPYCAHGRNLWPSHLNLVTYIDSVWGPNQQNPSFYYVKYPINDVFTIKAFLAICNGNVLFVSSRRSCGSHRRSRRWRYRSPSIYQFNKNPRSPSPMFWSVWHTFPDKKHFLKNYWEVFPKLEPLNNVQRSILGEI